VLKQERKGGEGSYECVAFERAEPAKPRRFSRFWLMDSGWDFVGKFWGEEPFRCAPQDAPILENLRRFLFERMPDKLEDDRSANCGPGARQAEKTLTSAGTYAAAERGIPYEKITLT